MAMQPAEIIKQLESLRSSQAWIMGNIGPDAPFLRQEAQKKIDALTFSIDFFKALDK